MRYSTFNWVERGRRGWIFGPWFGRTLTIMWDRRRNDASDTTAT